MSNLQPWTALTVDGLLSSMTHQEREDFGKVSTDLSVPDRVMPILEDLTQEVIGYIASHSRNTLSADPTLIPSEFKAKAFAIARYRLLATIPRYKPSDARKEERDTAEAYFKDVARGVIRPRPAPDAEANPVPDEKFVPSPRIVARKRRFSRDQQDGI